MAIYKDDEKYDWLKDDRLREARDIIIDKFTQKNGKVYLRTVNKNINRKGFKAFIPMQCRVRSSEGVFTYRYVETIHRNKDHVVYIPHTKKLDRTPVFDAERDIEFLVFLYAFSPVCSNGLNKRKDGEPGAIPVFEFEDIRGEAKKKREDRLLSVKVGREILNSVDEGGLSLDHLVIFARTNGYAINIDAMDKEKDEDRIRTEIYDHIERKNLFQKFLDSQLMSDKEKAESIVIELSNLGLIKFHRNGNEGQWRFKDNDGKVTEEIGMTLRVHGAQDMRGHLRDEIVRDPALRSSAQKRIAAKRIYDEEKKEQNQRQKLHALNQVTYKEATEIIEQAKAIGSLTMAATWYVVGEEKITNSKKVLIEKVQTDEVLREMLKKPAGS